MSELRVLFVCTGNICRSPIAEAVFRHRVKAAGLGGLILADSAGTLEYHVGEAPDVRAQAVARNRGYDLSRLRARQVEERDFTEFDYLLGMADEHVSWMLRKAAPEHAHKIGTLLGFTPDIGRPDVPDPYYGDLAGFELVLDLVERASDALLTQLQRELEARARK